MTLVVIPVAGQSLASGRGDLDDVPVFANNSRMFMFGNDYQWKLASEPIDSPVNQVDKISIDTVADAGSGICMGMMNRLCELRPEHEFAVIPCAKGSTRIDQWRRFWSRNYLYGSMMNRINEALKLPGTELAGLVWWQGEADTVGTSAQALGYLEKISRLFANIRSDLGRPDLPIAVARLNNLSHPNNPYWKTIRAAHDQICMKNVVVVSTDGLEYQKDRTHTTTPGGIDGGVRFADAINPLI
jgi:hypothetical protein